MAFIVGGDGWMYVCAEYVSSGGDGMKEGGGRGRRDVGPWLWRGGVRCSEAMCMRRTRLFLVEHVGMWLNASK